MLDSFNILGYKIKYILGSGTYSSIYFLGIFLSDFIVLCYLESVLCTSQMEKCEVILGEFSQ